MNSDIKEHDEHATPHGLSSAESAMHQQLVMLRCSCGANFEREQKFLDMHDLYKDDKYVGRFYRDKVKLCDACNHNKIVKALESLPKVLNAIASAT